MTPERAPTTPTAEAPEEIAGAGSTWTVRPGDDFWSIAATVISTRGGGPVGGYWLQLIQANRSRLPDPADPSLLFPGDVLVLPAPGTR